MWSQAASAGSSPRGIVRGGCGSQSPASPCTLHSWAPRASERRCCHPAPSPAPASMVWRPQTKYRPWGSPPRLPAELYGRAGVPSRTQSEWRAEGQEIDCSTGRASTPEGIQPRPLPLSRRVLWSQRATRGERQRWQRPGWREGRPTRLGEFRAKKRGRAGLGPFLSSLLSIPGLNSVPRSWDLIAEEQVRPEESPVTQGGHLSLAQALTHPVSSQH